MHLFHKKYSSEIVIESSSSKLLKCLRFLLNYNEFSNKEMILRNLLKWSDYGAEGGYNTLDSPPNYARHCGWRFKRNDNKTRLLSILSMIFRGFTLCAVFKYIPIPTSSYYDRLTPSESSSIFSTLLD